MLLAYDSAVVAGAARSELASQPHRSAPHLSRDRVNEGMHFVLAEPSDQIVVNDYARRRNLNDGAAA